VKAITHMLENVREGVSSRALHVVSGHTEE
jgi:hypothetical protein